MVTEPKWILARNQCHAFMLAARRCNEFRPLPSGLPQYLEVPTLVNYAFAIEVGLKALVMHESGGAGRASDPKKLRSELKKLGHDLRKCLDALSPSLRAQIVKDTESGYPGKAFDPDINIVRRVFEDWRYVFETGRIDTDLGFLQRFAAAVEASLDALPPRPRWWAS